MLSHGAFLRRPSCKTARKWWSIFRKNAPFLFSTPIGTRPREAEHASRWRMGARKTFWTESARGAQHGWPRLVTPDRIVSGRVVRFASDSPGCGHRMGLRGSTSEGAVRRTMAALHVQLIVKRPLSLPASSSPQSRCSWRKATRSARSAPMVLWLRMVVVTSWPRRSSA
jgi:hypothetical protein